MEPSKSHREPARSAPAEWTSEPVGLSEAERALPAALQEAPEKNAMTFSRAANDRLAALAERAAAESGRARVVELVEGWAREADWRQVAHPIETSRTPPRTAALWLATRARWPELRPLGERCFAEDLARVDWDAVAEAALRREGKGSLPRALRAETLEPAERLAERCERAAREVGRREVVDRLGAWIAGGPWSVDDAPPATAPETDADLRRGAVARAARHLRWPELCDAPSAVAGAELGAARLSGEALAAIADAERGDPRRRCWSDLDLDDGRAGQGRPPQSRARPRRDTSDGPEPGS